MIEKQMQFIAEEEGISFKQLLQKLKLGIRFLRTKIVILIFFAVIGAAIGFVKAYVTKPLYTASLTYVSEASSGSGTSALGSLASQFGFGGGGSTGGAGIFTNLSDIFKSRSMLERVLLKPVVVNGKTISFADFYINIKEFRIKKWYKKAVFSSTVAFPPNMNVENLSLEQSSTLGAIVSMIGNNDLSNKMKAKGSSFSELSITSENEFFSKVFLETLITEASEFYTQTKIKKAKKNVDLLQKQTDSVRQELNAAIGAVAIVNDQTFNLNSALNSKKTPSVRRQIDVQANTAILGQLVQNLEVAKMTLMQETPLIQVVDAPRLPLSMAATSRIQSMLQYAILFVILASVILLVIGWKRINE